MSDNLTISYHADMSIITDMSYSTFIIARWYGRSCHGFTELSAHLCNKHSTHLNAYRQNAAAI